MKKEQVLIELLKQTINFGDVLSKQEQPELFIRNYLLMESRYITTCIINDWLSDLDFNYVIKELVGK